MLILVSYDIIDDRQRTKLAKKLKDFGLRVQYSVFECDLDKKQLARMKKEALKFVDLEKDSLRIYKLCDSCAKHIESFGIKRGWKDEDQVIVV